MSFAYAQDGNADVYVVEVVDYGGFPPFEHTIDLQPALVFTLELLGACLAPRLRHLAFRISRGTDGVLQVPALRLIEDTPTNGPST